MSTAHVVEKLFGSTPRREKVGSLPARTDMFLEHPLITTGSEPNVTWFHCRACTSFYQLIEASLHHPDVAHLALNASNVHGKYLEVDACYDCDGTVSGFKNPRLLAIPAAS